MLEPIYHQASGLQALALASKRGPQCMAMVHHGDPAIELPLLWRLCTALVRNDYRVMVLDACSTESPQNPGLEQALEYDTPPDCDPADAAGWSVLPSALGLRHLLAYAEQTPQQMLPRIAQLFPESDMVLVYARAPAISSLFKGSGIKPLLSLSDHKSALLSSYAALKNLWVEGLLLPTVVHIASTPATAGARTATNNASQLRTCAHRFLQCEISPCALSTPRDEESIPADMEQLALRMIEGSIAIQTPAQRAMPAPHRGAIHSISRSH